MKIIMKSTMLAAATAASSLYPRWDQWDDTFNPFIQQSASSNSWPTWPTSSSQSAAAPPSRSQLGGYVAPEPSAPPPQLGGYTAPGPSVVEPPPSQLGGYTESEPSVVAPTPQLGRYTEPEPSVVAPSQLGKYAAPGPSVVVPPSQLEGYATPEPSVVTPPPNWGAPEWVTPKPSVVTSPPSELGGYTEPVAQPDQPDQPAEPAEPAAETWEETVARVTAEWAAATQSFDQPPATTQPKADDHTSKPFKQDSVRKYNLIVSSAAVNELNRDYAAEQYVPCSITTAYGTDSASTFDGCGCRYKGSVGSLLSCIDPDTGMLNGKCRKFSIKVDANEFRKDKQKIEGNKKLMFHGMGVDKSLVSERVAYNAMQELGLPSPRAAHAEVYVNGRFDGLYTVVEEVEKVLTKRYFSEDLNEGGGSVYKGVWFEDQYMTPEYLDKAHKSGVREDQFMQEVKAMIPYIGDCATLERYFDLDSIAAVTAFDNMVGLFDDWRMKHNFFWYVRENASGKKLVMIPWDYDRLNDSFNAPGGKRRAHAIRWTEKPNPFECANTASHVSLYGVTGRETGVKKVWLERVQANLPKDNKKPIECYHLTQLFAQCLDVDSKLAQFKAQMPAATLGRHMDEYAAQIAASVAKDSSISTQEWQAGVSALKSYLTTSANLAANLATSPQSKAQFSQYSAQPAQSTSMVSQTSAFPAFFGQSKFARRSNVVSASSSRSVGASPSGSFSRLKSLSYS